MGRLRLLLAVVVAGLIVAGGITYAVARPVTYESEARLLLSPDPEDPDQLPTLLDGFDRSGVAGTYVELLASADLARRANATAVDVTARWIPDTRVITVTANGDAGVVEGSLDRLIEEARGQQSQLNDLWAVSVLDPPTAAAKAGASLTLLIAASLLLGVLGGLFVLVLLGRYLPAAPAAEESVRTLPPAARREARRERRGGRSKR